MAFGQALALVVEAVGVELLGAVLLEATAAVLIGAAAGHELEVDAAGHARVAARPAVSTVTSSTAPSRAGTVPKKLVPPLLKPFDELFTPSIVGLMVPPGMPLKCVLPVPCGATAPGTSRANVNALRPASGSSVRSLLFSVRRDGVGGHLEHGVAPSTVIVCSSPPTVRRTRRSVVRPDFDHDPFVERRLEALQADRDFILAEAQVAKCKAPRRRS